MFKNYSGGLNHPIVGSVAYEFRDLEEARAYHTGMTDKVRYGRYDNPAWDAVEAEMDRIEKGVDSLVFPSGMNAITTLAMATLKAGDAVIYNYNCYRNIDRFFSDFMGQYEVGRHAVNTRDKSINAQIEAILIDAYQKSQFGKRNYPIKLIFLESPSNPELRMVDLIDLRERIERVLPRELWPTLAVDATLSTSDSYQPLRFGADVVMHSATKYLGGHGDFLMGTLTFDESPRGRKLTYHCRKMRNLLGGITTTENCARFLRSLDSYRLRVHHLNKAGNRIAHFLDRQSNVSQVFYPTVEKFNERTYSDADRQNYHAQQRMLGIQQVEKNLRRIPFEYTNGGGIVPFVMKGSVGDCTRFVAETEIPMATHFGSSKTTIEQYNLFTLATADEQAIANLGYSDNLIRLSLGLENTAWVIDRLSHALENHLSRQTNATLNKP